ncbi:MAG: DUF805 domain-containing protein [Hyphomonas sp.]|uniref:DUF805 domain-containing protein n=1 Tax=Hyphomonas sp. TaxID=87 RepID=UPI001842E9E6|nr:DUF805 domain-containing protein [Hyphomonas sp.]MBU3921234.1 DUF805 domain-containing protein [Alphaproteobacteria bacterium]MBA3067143.1 DUF805 domain-containing protein [Hyphomonas sp.]MBU4063061.1 DUF805 domain-containing protein [Alphaproteobacteria bacterium]MBU4164378.1 DUF805 domain-containing protein [Alphaproteobacteria bacterium]MBU4568836.1 DUF805 domain-containing protein [Alphaproteobacteria bacterium]
MRGEVVRPEDPDGPGVILGEDGRRYAYTAARVHKGAVLAQGSAVDFIALGEDARDIYPLGAPGGSGAPAGAQAQLAAVPEGFSVLSSVKADGLFTGYFRAATRNYFKFTGRARRAEYWSFVLVTIILLTACIIADTYISEAFFDPEANGNPPFVPILSTVLYIYSIVPGVSVTVRRLHDQGMSGLVFFVILIPYLGGLILFILMFFDSHRDPNKHGPSPKYGPAQAVNVFA